MGSMLLSEGKIRGLPHRPLLAGKVTLKDSVFSRHWKPQFFMETLKAWCSKARGERDREAGAQAGAPACAETLGTGWNGI